MKTLRVTISLGVLLGALVVASSGASAIAGNAEGSPAVSTALAYLQVNPQAAGAGSADVGELTVMGAYTSKQTGLTHVNVGQRRAGLEISRRLRDGQRHGRR